MRAAKGSRLVVSVSSAVSGAASIFASQASKAAQSRIVAYAWRCSPESFTAGAAPLPPAGAPADAAPALSGSPCASLSQDFIS